MEANRTAVNLESERVIPSLSAKREYDYGVLGFFSFVLDLVQGADFLDTLEEVKVFKDARKENHNRLAWCSVGNWVTFGVASCLNSMG